MRVQCMCTGVCECVCGLLMSVCVWSTGSPTMCISVCEVCWVPCGGATAVNMPVCTSRLRYSYN